MLRTARPFAAAEQSDDRENHSWMYADRRSACRAGPPAHAWTFSKRQTADKEISEFR
jgi:hypothetical protein